MTPETYGYEWAVDKIRQDAHCVATVMPQSDDNVFLVDIRDPSGELLFRGNCHEAHIVQFVIEAVMIAYMEMMA